MFLIVKGKETFLLETLTVANEQGKELLNTLSPGMLDNPMIEYAYDMTINELIGQAADAKPLFAAVMAELNKKA